MLRRHRSRYVLGAVVALAAIAVPVWAQQPVSRQLSNGVELLVMPAPNRPIMVVTRYFAGFRDEPDSLRGLAHLAEHLAMRETRGGPSLAVLAAQLGWDVGAITGEWVTTFTTSTTAADSSALAAMLRLERWRMTDLAIDHAAVQVESRRIAAEIGAAHDRVAAHRDLDRITAGDVRAFYERFYVPSNALITIESSLPVDEVLRIAERELALVPAAPPPPTSAARDSARAAVVIATIQSADSALGTRVSVPQWLIPDTVGLHWRSSGRLRWASASGGRPDTVFFAIWIAAPPTLSAEEIGALELLARTFGDLRLPDGRPLATGTDALGASLTVRSLPYPPLATSDRFRMLGTPVTPVGLAGLQLVGSVPRAAAQGTLRLLATALADGRAAAAIVSGEVRTQVGLLAQAAEAAPPRVEVAFRRSVPVLPPETTPMWRPAELSQQRRTMERLSWREVTQVLATLVEAGTVRVALLGVDPEMAAGWLSPWAWPVRGDPSPAMAPRGCSPPEGGTSSTSTSQAPTTATADVYFALCIPEGNPGGVQAQLQVANAILGGREDAVLASRLRGETGLAYQFASRLVPTWDGGPTLWYLRIGTRGATVQEAIREVHDVLVRVAQDGVPGDLIAQHREWLAARRLASGENGLGWVTALVTTGLSPEQEAVRIRSVPAEAVRALWRYWDPAGLVVTASEVRM